MKQASKLWGGLSIVKAALPLSTQVTIAPYFFRAPSATLLLTPLSSTTNIRLFLSRFPRFNGFPLVVGLFFPILRVSWKQRINTLSRRGFVRTVSTKPADLSSLHIAEHLEVANRKNFGQVSGLLYILPFGLSSLSIWWYVISVFSSNTSWSARIMAN